MTTLSLTVLAAVALLGAALLWASIADRRRQALQQRLKNLIAPTRDQDEPVPALTLRRRMARARPGLQYLAVSALSWLHAELAATGNRIGVPHLFVVALMAGCSGSAFLLYFQLVSPALAILLGVAAA